MDISAEKGMSAPHWSEAARADFAVLGDPITHSRSPQMHGAAFAALGLEFRYEAIQVPLSEFEPTLAHLAGLGYRGVNCTVPLKEAALVWADSPDNVARLTGAANTLDLISRRATNTDVSGLRQLVREACPDATSALVLGAGGSARASIVALQMEGIAVSLWNRTLERAEDLAVEMDSVMVVASPDLEPYDLVINATSAGLTGDALPVDWSTAAPGTFALDLMYGKPSEYLDGARAAGLSCEDGLGLLVAQGADSLRWWLGVDPPLELMRRAVCDD